MRSLKYVGLLAVLLFAVAASANAQVAVGVRVGPVVAGVGPAPICAYGYYNYYPYACAPYGYYGSSWFVNGVFIGAGPWYHSRAYYLHPGYGYRPPVYRAPYYHSHVVAPYHGAYGRNYGYRAPAHSFAGHSGGYHSGGYHSGHRR